jgi:SAM-dependent methyltransferase
VAPAKRYDRAYFEKWYRSRDRVHSPGELPRKVALAVATAEYFLRRPIKTVLDVGCGEGAWLPHLRALRPRITYTGLDSSDYVVGRFGSSRNIRKAAFGDLPSLNFTTKFDLIVCSDVMHYLPESDIRSGVRALAGFAAGLAYFEVLTAEDDVVGDLEGMARRPSAWYRKVFTAAGFAGVAPYCWLIREIADDSAGLER